MAFSAGDLELHERMLKAWIETLRNEGYTIVSAALPEYVDKPKPIRGGPAPDLVAKDPENFVVVGEVKTSGDIDNAHTKLQLSNYGNAASKVLLLVPNDSLDVAVSAVESLECSTIEVWCHAVI